MARESLLLVVWRAPICSRCYFSSWFCNWHGSRKIMLRLALWGPNCIFHIWILLAKHIKATRKLENEDSEQIIFYALMLKSQNMEEWRRIKKIKIWWILYSHSTQLRKTRWRRLSWVLFLDLPGRYRDRTQHSLAVSLQPATRRLPQLLISGKTWPTLSSPPMREAASRFTCPRLGTGPTYNLMFLELLCPELLMCHVTITPHWASQTPAATGSTLAQCCVLEYQCSQFNTESTSVYVFPVYLLKENKNTREMETLTKWKREISVKRIKRGNISSCYASAPIWNIFKKTHRWNCQDLTLGERFLCL